MSGPMHKWSVYLLTLLLLVSCGKQPTDEVMRGVFRLNLPKGVSSLDPAYARDQNMTWMCAQLFNGLVELDENLRIIPSIAHKYEVSDSGKSFTFFLREDVRFHKHPVFGPDSTRIVTAKDFKYAFTRICDPSTASPGLWIFNGKVKGVGDFNQGIASEVAGFQIVDKFIFRIRLDQPFPPFLSLLTMPFASVVPEEAIELFGRDFRSNPVGTGPFCFKAWDEGNSLVLMKNRAYFEKGLPYLEAIQVSFIESELSSFVEFTQGKLDFINGLDESFKDELVLQNGDISPAYVEKYNFLVAPQLNVEFIAIQMDTSLTIARGHPLADRKVRQALNYAIDRPKLVRYLLNGNGFPAESWMIPRGMPGYDVEAVPGYAYNPEKAALLLTEAGFPGGKGLPVLSLKSNPKYQGIMEFVQKSWESLGIRSSVDNMQGAALRELASKGEINLWRASWIADYPDGENYLSLFYSGYMPPGGANRMRYANPRFDSLYRASLLLPLDSARFPLYQEMERICRDDAPVIPLFYDRILRIVQPGVEGMETNAMNLLYLKRVRKTK